MKRSSKPLSKSWCPTPTKRMSATLLRRSAELIERYGWIQKQIGDRDTGFCVLGAVSEAAQFNRVRGSMAAAALRKHLGSRSLAAWNDDNRRTKEEVTGALRKAARKLEHGLNV